MTKAAAKKANSAFCIKEAESAINYFGLGCDLAALVESFAR